MMNAAGRGKFSKKLGTKNKNPLKDPIEVYCRIRPLENENDQTCVKTKDVSTIVLSSSNTLKDFPAKEMHCAFKYVFNENISQKELFNHVALPSVHDLLQGSNSLLFTYGITSSGKTYTMLGTPQNGGLLPRTLDVIFNSIAEYQAAKYVFKPDKLNGFDVQCTAEAIIDQQKELASFSKRGKRKDVTEDSGQRVADVTTVNVESDMNYAVFIQYVEIYNNYTYDLLEETTVEAKPSKTLNSKMLRKDALHNMCVFGVTETEVKSVGEALELFYKGQLKRRISHTALNTESSRSHSVFTIRVVQAPLNSIGAEVLQDKDSITIGQLSLVDLAGSARSVRSKTTGQKLREAGNINASLMALRTCIETLRETQNQGSQSKMVPYRESKLTHLFKSFFEGEGKVKMIVCVNPRADDYNENIHVMKFAEMTQDVMISRATPISTPNVLGLKSGRGNLYKEAVCSARERGVPVINILAPAVYNLGPEFPPIEKMTVQMDLEAREQQVKNLEAKLSASEQTIDTMQRQLATANLEAQNYRSQLNVNEEIIVDQGRELERIKMLLQGKLASEKDHMKRIMERRLAEKQAELEVKMCITDEKFRQLREILNADDWEVFGEVALPASSTVQSVNTEVKMPVETRLAKAKSALALNGLNIGKATPAVLSKAESATSKENRTKSIAVSLPRRRRSRSGTDLWVQHKPVGHLELALNGLNIRKATPAVLSEIESVASKENRTKSITVAKPRHRRSRSGTDLWIQHKPVRHLELGTVLQPKMKKRSVSKLDVKDVTKSDVAQYVLRHQEQDSGGEIETQLYKGDVIPSAGGGAQVVFNDVEKLKQVSPPPTYNLRKRSAENVPLRDVEERCTVAVECHGLPAKVVRRTK